MSQSVRISAPTPDTVSKAVAAATNGVDTAAEKAGGSPRDGDIGSLAVVFAIRQEVFVGEQQIDPEIEWDDNESIATHLLLLDRGRPVGTARVRQISPEVIKCERIAVRQADRHNGWGGQLMNLCAAYATENGATQCLLHAQQHVAAFYRQQGYSRIGEPFEEAGIPHVKMQCDLTDRPPR